MLCFQVCACLKCSVIKLLYKTHVEKAILLIRFLYTFLPLKRRYRCVINLGNYFVTCLFC